MSDYKSAKEAFHSDNLGASLWSINAVSLAAWTSYALYAVIARRRPVSVVLDYATTCLPLLLAVTSFAQRPYLLNGLIATLACIAHLYWPTTTGIRDPVGTSTSKQRKSKGKWLDESDSDEEPAVPVAPFTLAPTSSATSTAIAYPSSTALESNISSPRLSVESSTSSPTTLSPIAPDGPSQRTWKRRHSPTPSTHTHTAINILATPEAAKFPPDTPSPRSYPSRKDKSEVKESVAITANDGMPKSPFLSVYRAHMMVMTIHCILAVDFPIFPRWQGKCEDFGTSLMDVGVGSFVFSLGIVSVRQLATKGQTGQSGPAWLWSCVKALRKSSAVLALGVVRVLMVKGAEYPEHVTEYGVHWNFFFTLGLLPVLGRLLAPIKRIGISWSAQAILVMATHQLALSGGLQTWVLSPVREGLVGMNKEGLVSLPGYAAIYLLGLSTGQHVLRSSVDPHSATKTDARVGENAQEHAVSRAEKRRTELAMELFGYSVGWWTLVIGWTAFGGKVSRRMANPPYVLWTAAYNSTFLLGYLVIEMLFFPTTTATTTPRSPAVPRLLDAINRNGLVVFLVANLLTGLVNVSMETMYLGDRAALVVLLGYSGAVCAIAWFTRGRRLKL